MSANTETARSSELTRFQKSILLIYFALLLTCIALLVGSEFLGPATRKEVLPIAADGFKLVLGALIGTLSTLVSSRKGSTGDRTG